MSENTLEQPNVVVHGVVFQLIANELYVLLVQRQSGAIRGRFSLPGGQCVAGNDTFESIVQLLKLQTGVVVKKLLVMEQLYTFDTQTDKPAEHSVAITYLGLTRNLTPLADNTTDVYPLFSPVNKLPPSLNVAHREIIDSAVERLQGKLTYTNAIFALVPKLFTFAQLQDAYQTILGQKLDKRNFRKKFLGLELIHSTDEYLREGPHRPARLYRFNQQSLEYLSRSFD